MTDVTVDLHEGNTKSEITSSRAINNIQRKGQNLTHLSSNFFPLNILTIRKKKLLCTCAIKPYTMVIIFVVFEISAFATAAAFILV